MRTYVIVALIAAIVTYMAVPLSRLASYRMNALKEPGERDVHLVPMPRLGGLAMWAGALAAVIAAMQSPFLAGVFAANHKIWVIFAAGTVMCALGAIDDVMGLHWAHRLAVQIGVGWILASQGVSLLTLPIGGVTVGSYQMSTIVTVVAFVVMVNAVNFIDGLDGLAAGVVLISAGAFFMYSYQLTRGINPDNFSSLASLITAICVGICLGFLPHNSHPARIFMGDSGAYLLGTLLVTATVTVTGQVNPSDIQSRGSFAFLPMLIPLACLFVPLADFVGAVIRRIGKGHSPFKADGKHFHHLLLRLGHTHRRAVWVMYLWTIFIAGGTVTLGIFEPRVVATILVIGAGICIIFTFGAMRNLAVPRGLAHITAVHPEQIADAERRLNKKLPAGAEPGLATVEASQPNATSGASETSA